MQGRNFHLIGRWAAVLWLYAIAVSTACADVASGTIDKIRETGTISIGFRESSLPFSYYDEQQHPVGYSMDLCLRVVDAVRRELNLPGLSVALVPVTSATRIPLMANGTIDLECGSTSNTPERQRQVAFTVTHYVSATRYVALVSSHMASIQDLAGKTVVATSGTTNLKQLQDINQRRNLGMTIVSSKDHAEGFLMVETGRAAAFALDDVLLAALVANAKAPDMFGISTDAIAAADPYGIMLRRDDPAFKHLVDGAMTGIMSSGEILGLYDRWFTKPIPPKGISLNLPMSAALREAIRHPTDSADPDAYEQRHATGFDWSVFMAPAPDGRGASYGATLLWGLETTLGLVVLAWPLALVVGVVAGTARISGLRPLAVAGAAYVEIFRNTPLLAQMFLWYFVVPEFLPHGIGQWVKTQSQAPFVTAALCLGLYTGARVAEQVRAGLESLSSGQRYAALALGMTSRQAYGSVLLPQAFRIILPPLTSELLALVKNSSVALTIGVVELTARARAMQEYSFHVFEAFAAATLIYVVVTLVLTLVMRRVERHFAVPGYMGGGAAGS